ISDDDAVTVVNDLHVAARSPSVMRFLVTGAGGYLGAYLLRERPTDSEVIALTGSRRAELFGIRPQPIDLTAVDSMEALQTPRPDVILHAAALSRVSDCHRDPERASLVNTCVTETLVQLAVKQRARLVFVSTDLVFDGARGGYHEDDIPNPLSVYGLSKSAAEQAVLDVPGNVVVRISLLFGPSRNGRGCFFDEQVAALQRGLPVTLFDDEWRTPLDLATAARALWAVARSDFSGILHLGGPQRLSRWEMGQR